MLSVLVPVFYTTALSCNEYNILVPMQCPQKTLAYFVKVVNYECKMFMKSTSEVEGDSPGVNLVKRFTAVIYHF